MKGTTAALLLLLAAARPALAGHVDDAITAANALRLQGCDERPALDSALARSAALDVAAEGIAAGTELKAAASAAGYRAKRIARIRIARAAGADYRRILAANFCAIVADPELADIGAYRAADETWLVLATPLTLEGGANPDSAARQLHAGINAARGQARRCGPEGNFDAAGTLRRRPELDAAAAVQARDMAARGRLGHDGSDGSSPADRVTRSAYDWGTVGENLAAGQPTPAEVVDTWIASPGHCRNLMDPRFTETGIAVAINDEDDKVIYWVQVYARPR